MANPSIVVEFLANTAGLTRGIRDAEKSTKGFGGTLKTLGKTGGLAAGAAGLGALAFTLKTGISEFQDAQKVAAQTNAVIKSTGGVAKISATQVADLSEALMKKSGVDDEAIASGENLLLTFTNIRNEAGKGNDVFNQTTAAALDMSVALGTDVKGAAMQLGKALNDPAAGLGKLARSGVTFTQAQKDMVKQMQASGDTLGAQKIILAEVNKEFAGSAEAIGDTLPGQIAIMRESFSNFAGELVAKLIPVLTQVVGFIREHWPEIAATVKQTWETSMKPTLVAIGLLVKSVVELIVANWKTIGPIVSQVAEIVKTAFGILTNVIKLFTALLRGDWKAAWEALKGIVSGAIDQVLNLLKLQALVGGAIVKAAVALGKAILGGVVDGLVGIGQAAWGVIDNIGSTIASMGKTIASWGADLAADLVRGIVGGFKGIGSQLAGLLKDGLNVAIRAWNSLAVPGFTVAGPGPLPDIHFPSIPFPDIPLLARGGIVTGPTLAMLGEAGPEAVLPLGSGGAGFEVRVFIGDQELRGLIRTEVVSANDRTARTLIGGVR